MGGIVIRVVLISKPYPLLRNVFNDMGYICGFVYDVTGIIPDAVTGVEVSDVRYPVFVNGFRNKGYVRWL